MSSIDSNRNISMTTHCVVLDNKICVICESGEEHVEEFNLVRFCNSLSKTHNNRNIKDTNDVDYIF